MKSTSGVIAMSDDGDEGQPDADPLAGVEERGGYPLGTQPGGA